MINNKEIDIKYLKNIYEKLGYRLEIDDKNNIGKLFFNKLSDKEDCIISLNNCFGDVEKAVNIIRNIENLNFSCRQLKIIFLKGLSEDIDNIEFVNIVFHDKSYIEKLQLHLLNHTNYIELTPFNEKICKEKTKELLENKKIPLIQATGTGKTSLCFSIIYNIPKVNKVLYIAPSKYILGGVKENISPKNINIKYITYSKLMHNLNKIKEEYFDLIVLDEFHRCGATEWGASINNLLENKKYKYVIGLTATPVRNLDNDRNMANELFNNNGENILPVSKAISYGIIPSPVFYSGFYNTSDMYTNYKNFIKTLGIKDSDTLKKINDMQIKSDQLIKEKLKLFIKKYNTNGKFIVFCKDLKHIYENKDMVISWLESAGLDNIKSFVIHSYINSSEKDLYKFKNLEKNAVVFCVNKLSEGINLELSGIIMLRNTKSSIVYFQQIGRCLRANFKNRPIIMDLVSNSNGVFIKRFKNHITKEYNRMNRLRWNYGLDEISISDDMFIEDTKEIVDMFKSIEISVYKPWDDAFNELKEFYKINGHSSYPVCVDGKKTYLGTWCSKNRTLYRNGQLSQDRIDKLNSLDFIWNTYDAKWITSCKKYKHELENNNLSKQSINFIENCRRQFSRGELSEERKKQLKELGIDAMPKRQRTMFDYKEATKELQNYIDKNNKIPPKEYITNDIKIGNWVRNLKNQKDKDKIIKKINRKILSEFIYK